MRTGIDAVTQHHDLVTKDFTLTISWLEAAVAKIDEALTTGKDACSPEEIERFTEMQSQYQMRADMLKRMQEELQAVMPFAPQTNRVEQDAVTILQAKGKY